MTFVPLSGFLDGAVAIGSPVAVSPRVLPDGPANQDGGAAPGESRPGDVAPGAPAEKRLRAHIESFLVRLFDEGHPAWLGKLMAREMSEPTPGLDVIVQEKIRGTYRRVEAIVRELVGPGASDDDVRACVLSVQGQCLFYRHCHPVLTRLFPERSFGREEVPELARHIVRFSLAGIRATGRRARKRGAG